MNAPHPQMGQANDRGKPRPKKGGGSFCVPRVAVEALRDGQADAYMIMAYLSLACFTDATGQFSSAGISVIHRRTGANKTREGTLQKALDRLRRFHVTRRSNVSEDGIERTVTEDLGPILYTREDWCAQTGEIFPDGPSAKSQIRWVLPTFDEDLDERVWFGSSLVEGYGAFQPLRILREAGDVAARLLLDCYLRNDMVNWGGVSPVGENAGPWVPYGPATDHIAIPLDFGREVIPVSKGKAVVLGDLPKRLGARADEVHQALAMLVSSGLLYEVIVVIDRKFDGYGAAVSGCGGNFAGPTFMVPEDATPIYDLHVANLHGTKLPGERGVAWPIAKTLSDLGVGLWNRYGKLAGVFGALVREGFATSVIGIYRLRCRVANAKNAGVTETWLRISEGTWEVLRVLQDVRAKGGLDPLPPEEESDTD